MADAYSLDSLYELAKKALWATWMEMAPRYLEPVYALSGAATEEEFYADPWWQNPAIRRSMEEMLLVKPGPVPNPDYHGEPWKAPYSGFRNIRVTSEVLEDSRSPNLVNEINSRLLAAMGRKFWSEIEEFMPNPNIVLGGIWE